MSEVRKLLDRWRSVGRDVTVYDVLARGNVKHSQHASPSDTLFRCMEQLADAMQADACNADDASPSLDAAAERVRGAVRMLERSGQ